MYANLIATITELGEDIGAKHFGITSSNIQVQISSIEEAIESFVKSYVLSAFDVRILDLRHHLYLVDEYVSSPSI